MIANDSHFLKDGKVAKLKPMFEKGTKTDLKNFRSIYFLLTDSKIIDKVIHDQAMNYLAESGFGKNHSTEASLSYLTDKMLTSFDSGLLTGIIFIDSLKAFNNINHYILLEKCLLFFHRSINWFKLHLLSISF